MKTKEDQENFQLLVRTYSGFEELLAREIVQLGGGDATPITRGVECTGDLGFIYKLNLCLRTGLRVLVKIKSFTFRDNRSFYDELYQIPWTTFFDRQKTFRIDTLLFSDLFSNSMFVSQLAKDAMVDRFRSETGERPFVDTRSAGVYVSIYIKDNQATIYLDSSGESLHKRGYRKDQVKAPLSEVMAAGIIMLSGWTHHFPLIDPMCGSGTFSIEAALIANKIPPGIFRDGFSFENWKNYDEDLFDRILDAVTQKIQNNPIEIRASDKSRRAIDTAKSNAANAEVGENIRFSLQDFSTYPEQTRKSFLFLNPPYGERMDINDITELYGMIGSTFKHKFPGSEAWLFTSNTEGLKHIGLKPSSRIRLYNGPLECWLMKYELYSGTKKQGKQ